MNQNECGIQITLWTLSALLSGMVFRHNAKAVYTVTLNINFARCLIVGCTPGEVFSGGPFAWGVTLAVFGNEASEIIKAKLEESTEKPMSKGMQEALDEFKLRI